MMFRDRVLRFEGIRLSDRVAERVPVPWRVSNSVASHSSATEKR
jgi:hypothetical protein